MTREEAIAILQEEMDGNLELTIREWRERDEQRLFPAIRMAIEALRADVISREVYDKRTQADEEIIDSYRQEFQKALSADAVQGEWKIDEYGIYHCPFCHAINNTVYKSFCPNCGARMKGGAE